MIKNETNDHEDTEPARISISEAQNVNHFPGETQTQTAPGPRGSVLGFVSQAYKIFEG